MDHKKSLLVVDDASFYRAILGNIFNEEYDIIEASSGREALDILSEMKDNVAAMLLDLVMPDMDGFSVLIEMNKKGLLSLVPVIVITGVSGSDEEIRMLDLGASDIITKPFVSSIVLRRVKNVISSHLYRQQLEEVAFGLTESVQRSNESLVNTLSAIADHQGKGGGGHNARVRRYVRCIAQDLASNRLDGSLSGDDIEAMVSASALHDIGKLVLPQRILDKTERLTADELELMRTHTIEGFSIVSRFDQLGNSRFLRYAEEITRSHHERYDGNGFPDKLVGDRIPLSAQIVGLADAYDALVRAQAPSAQPPYDDVVRRLSNGEAGMFSRELIESLKREKVRLAEIADKYSDNSDGAYAGNGMTSLAAMDDIDCSATGEMKYETMLKYVGKSVLELDYQNRCYRYVSHRSDVADSYGDMGTELSAAVANCVHEEDRRPFFNMVEEVREEIEQGSMEIHTLPVHMMNVAGSDSLKVKLEFRPVYSKGELQKTALVIFERMPE